MNVQYTWDVAGDTRPDAAVAAVVAARRVIEILVTEAVAAPRLAIDQRLTTRPNCRRQRCGLLTDVTSQVALQIIRGNVAQSRPSSRGLPDQSLSAPAWET